MIHILAAGYPPTSPYPPATPALVTIAEWATPVIVGALLLLRVGTSQERKQNRRR